MDYTKRYFTHLNELFTKKKWLQLQVDIELEWLRVLVRREIIPYNEINSVTVDEDFVSQVEIVEKETHHDVMSMVKVLSNRLDETGMQSNLTSEGGLGEWVHFGLTSQDINDTATALLLKEVRGTIMDDLLELKNVLIELTKKHKNLPMIGRTHGQHATPVTLGFKFANFLFELDTAIIYLDRVNFYGKLSGAVGTYAALGEEGLLSAKEVMTNLGISGAMISTQVVSRLFLADYNFALASIMTVLERIGKEIRNLQRPEIGELMESFSENQVGSSTMPHKRNPHKSERVCGLARIVRSLVQPALETVALEHERDITNSSVERVTLSTASVLTHYCVLQMKRILEGLVINSNKINRNLHLLGGRQLSEKIMIELARKIGRQKAHEMLRLENDEWKQYFDEEELDKLGDPNSYLGLAPVLADCLAN